MTNDNITTEPSKGWAGLISMLITILSGFEMAYPGKLPFVAKALHALPFVGQSVPLVIAILGTIYTAASSAVPQIRALMPWKKTRVTVVGIPGSF